jgi:hypothetical protein
MGYPSVLTAKTWGFYDVLFKGKAFEFLRPYGSYVMENVLFKISFPAEFHAQTAVECAMQLHPHVKERLSDIAKITLRTHESAIRIIDKRGPLANPADRDHCIQYMVAVPLIHGRLTAADYEDNVAADPTGARSPTGSRSSSRTARSSRKSSSSIRSATAGGARKACLCSWKSFGPTSHGAFRRSSRRRSSTSRSMPRSSKPCRCTSSST